MHEIRQFVLMRSQQFHNWKHFFLKSFAIENKKILIWMGRYVGMSGTSVTVELGDLKNRTRSIETVWYQLAHLLVEAAHW